MDDVISWIIASLVAVFVGSCAGASKSPQSPDRCAAQICTGDGGACDMIVLNGVWLWNGQACVQTHDSGCGVAGPDCGSLYESKADCEADWSACMGAP